MEILVAKHAGFCVGVERAYKIALQENKDRPIYMLGNLVHNKQVVANLKDHGIVSVSSLAEVPPNSGGTLLISAHGVPPAIYAAAEKLSLKIIDTTCPWVKKAQKIAKELADRGCRVIIVGDRGHVEVVGLLGWTNGQGTVIESLAETASLQLAEDQCVGVIAQTTQSEELFQAIVSALRQKHRSVEAHDTICGATTQRQDAAVTLAKKVDLMLVIGDKMSANTKRLTELCSRTGTETHQIETAAEIDRRWFKGKEKIGVTAGASTPEWVTGEVISLLPGIML